MRLNRKLVDRHIVAFSLKDLFLELGWDSYSSLLPVMVGNDTYTLRGIAEKRGVQIYELALPEVPDYSTRRKIETKVAANAYEHLIIFTDSDKRTQLWQWVARGTGKTKAYREHSYRKGQATDALIQKLDGITFTLDEEETLDLSTVTTRLRDGFDREKVTNSFFKDFQKEHKRFLGAIEGILNSGEREWYTSVMLNRLMFIYFIQRKGFLDGDTNYLRNKLEAIRKLGKKDKFQSFYRVFLLRLFHDGLGSGSKDADLVKLIDNVPYLNGGLFDKHQLERLYDTIHIPDEAFENIFSFFDGYNWHLDERPLSDGREINPDVLGYIFEKYINQKQMGAYYTKEDITNYISKNTIIPYILDSARKRCAIAFEGENSVWRLLQAEPERYIYDALKKGFDKPLPAEIAAGIDDVSKRDTWNSPTLEGYALPTEIWRETVTRWQRYTEIKTKLSQGEITSVSDLITYNLNIEQFMQDVIDNSEGVELLRAIWLTIVGRIPRVGSNAQYVAPMSILDPTCGSGAFLFAALNILRPLYEACLTRMESFLSDAQRNGAKEGRYSDFEHTLADVAKHANRDYYTLKSIILNNLYGVDIMEEAVEIAKLRLFLKLAAQVEPDAKKPNYGIEPLPDIDFNIRAGNTLVGYATKEEVKKAVMEEKGQGKLVFGETEDALTHIEKKAGDVDRLFKLFRQQQTLNAGSSSDLAETKRELRERLRELEKELNTHLAREYGVDVKKQDKYVEWLEEYYPFHWFIEFHGIIESGGFNVIVGNPPYVELKALKEYKPLHYKCEDSGNLYALVMERCFSLIMRRGRQGYIVPVSSVSTDRYKSLQKLLEGFRVHYSSYDDRPSRLFDGLEHIRLTIHLISPSQAQDNLFSTRYHKWSVVERESLFAGMRYAKAKPAIVDNALPKISYDIEEAIILKLSCLKYNLSNFYHKGGKGKIFYSRKVGYFLQVLNFTPRVIDGAGNLRPPSEFKELYFDSQLKADLSLAALNSNLFYWFVTVFSDCRHVNKREVDAFPVNLQRLENSGCVENLRNLSLELMEDLQTKSKERRMRFKHDSLTIQTIIPKFSKPIIDEIDRALAQHYGFTDEELDFIINYDIKYRMGSSLSDDDGDA